MRIARGPIAAAALLALAACAAPGRRPPPAAVPSSEAVLSPAAAEEARREIVDVLVRSTEGWNRRDLDAFMVPYLDADETTFVGGAGLIRGKAAIQQNYATGWFAPGRDPGQLRFQDIEVRLLGRDHALAIGRYVVTAEGREPSTGLFSLTLRRTPAGWRIIHDHSS